MQMNEHVGQVQQGTRPPAIEQALDETRATPETRAKRRAAEESCRIGAKPAATQIPRRFGAGF